MIKNLLGLGNDFLNIFFDIDIYAEFLDKIAEAAFMLWNKVLEAIVTVIEFVPSEWSPGAYDRVITIAGNLVGFSEGLLVLVFCIGIFGTTASFTEHKSWTSMLRLLARFILAKTGIECIATVPLGSTGNTILQTIDNIVYGIKNIIAGSGIGEIALEGGLPDEVKEALKGDTSIWEMFFYAIFIMLLLGISAYMGIRLFILVYGRFFKVYLLTAISPIPMAFFGSGSTQRTGVGFLKTYIIALFEVIIIVVALIIYGAFVTEINKFGGTSFIFWIFNSILSMTLLVAVIQGAERMLREIAS